MNKYHYDNAIFVDDNENNLKTALNDKRINTMLALWGNPQPGLKGYLEQEAIEKIKNYCISR